MSMPDEDSKKMEEVRKFSAIYGRFDAKRKPEKPLTLHEVSENKTNTPDNFTQIYSNSQIFTQIFPISRFP